MATDTKPKSRSDYIREHQEHIKHKKEAITAYIKNMREGFKNPKETRELIEQVERKFDKDAKFLSEQEIDQLAARLTRETEQYLIKIANEKPEKQEKKEESSVSPINDAETQQEQTPVEKMVTAIEKNKQAQAEKVDGKVASGPSEEQLKNNPLLAFKASVETQKSTTPEQPTKKPSVLKRLKQTIKRGGNVDRERESKPDRPLPTKTQQPAKTPVNTMLAAIERNKAAQVAKKTTPTLPAQKPPSQKMPEQKTPKPVQSAADKNAEKTKAPKIEHKPIPYIPPYQLGNEEQNYADIDIFAPDEDASGRAAKGNPNAPAGNPNAEPYDSPQQYQPSAYNQPAGGGYQPAGGDYGGVASRPGGHNPLKANVPKLPSMPTIPGGAGSGKNIGTLIRLAQQTPIGRAITIGVIIFLLILLILLYVIFGGSDTEEKEKAERAREDASQETLTIDKAMLIPLLPRYEVGQKITFKITVLDTQPAQEITIIDYLPEGVSLLEQDVTSSWTKRVYDPVKKTLTFKASENVTPAQLTPPSFNFTVTYLITQPYKQYFGGVEANAVASASGSFAGNNIPPSNDNCHGLYSGYMKMLAPIGKTNYGDPTCELVKQDANNRWFIDKDIILRYMSQSPTGPKFSERAARGVFECIMPKECSYNVNAYNPNSKSAQSRGTPGAFGCFQMNAKGYSNQGQPEDVGDVVWQLQIYNANQWRLKHNGGTWSRYWPESYSGCLNEFGL